MAKQQEETAESEKTNYSRADQRLLEIEQRHKEELKEVTQLYEDRIDSLREAYSRELEKLEQTTELVMCSRESSGIYEREKLYLTINRESSGLEEIREREQEECTDRTHLHSLKEDIRMGQSLSECSRRQTQHRIGQEDTESEFTCKYFEHPYSRFSFHKKEQEQEVR